MAAEDDSLIQSHICSVFVFTCTSYNKEWLTMLHVAQEGLHEKEKKTRLWLWKKIVVKPRLTLIHFLFVLHTLPNSSLGVTHNAVLSLKKTLPVEKRKTKLLSVWENRVNPGFELTLFVFVPPDMKALPAWKNEKQKLWLLVEEELWINQS